MKDCNNCERRFNCFTLKEGDACPVILGEEITRCYPYYGNVACDLFGRVFREYGYGVRIQPHQILKLLRKAKFRTTKKYNRIYLEVIDDEDLSGQE
jgi:hypothetical protein